MIRRKHFAATTILSGSDNWELGGELSTTQWEAVCTKEFRDKKIWRLNEWVQDTIWINNLFGLQVLGLGDLLNDADYPSGMRKIMKTIFVIIAL